MTAEPKRNNVNGENSMIEPYLTFFLLDRFLLPLDFLLLSDLLFSWLLLLGRFERRGVSRR